MELLGRKGEVMAAGGTWEMRGEKKKEALRALRKKLQPH